jgi:ribosome-binding protein aMBF1 (putative translation factor)
VRRNFDELQKDIRSDPQRAERVRQFKSAMRDAITFSELREARGMSQQQIADRLDVSQARVSQIERGRNLYLNTLSSYIEALDGHLKLVAEFPDGPVTIDVRPE